MSKQFEEKSQEVYTDQNRSDPASPSIPPEPAWLAPILENIPDALKALNRYVSWRLELREAKKGKFDWTKVPVNPRTGENAKPNDVATFGTFEQAYTHYLKNKDRKDKYRCAGVGIVLSDTDDLLSIDLDHVRNLESGEIQRWAYDVILAADSYTEVSPSGTGIRIFARGKKPGKKCRNGNIEIYEHTRFMTITGHLLPNVSRTIEHRQSAIEKLYAQYFPPEEHKKASKPAPEKERDESEPQPEAEPDDDEIAQGGDGALPDPEIIRLAMEAKNGQKFSDLMDGNYAGYPSIPTPSEADLALCSILAFYDQNPATIDRIFRKSYLFREKWDERHGERTYGAMTIEKALSGLKKTYQPGKHRGGEKPSKSDQQKQQLLQIVRDEVFLFRTKDDRAFAAVRSGEFEENLPVLSRKFRLWLGGRFNAIYKQVAVARMVGDVLGVVEWSALSGDVVEQVALRVAGKDGAVYVDLANGRNEAVCITRTRWRVVSDPPVRFYRPVGMLPLPYPVQGTPGEGYSKFRRLCNVAEERDWVLLLGWLVGSLNPEGSKPVLCLRGEQGSAKSTLTRLLRETIDPNVLIHRSLPTKEKDFYVAAQNSLILSYDNIRLIPDWLSDGFCRMATGGGSSYVALYTDADEKIFNARRSIILNGLGAVITRHDLLDRTLIVKLDPIPEDKRRTEQDVLKEFETIRPALMADLFTAVSVALRNAGTINTQGLPRMADFARWVLESEQALPWKQGQFLRVFGDARRDVVRDSLAGDSLVERIFKLLRIHQGHLEGSPADLYKLLTVAEDPAFSLVRDDDLPKSASALSRRLAEIESFLRTVGVTVRRGRSDKRTIIIECDPMIVKPGGFGACATAAEEEREAELRQQGMAGSEFN